MHPSECAYCAVVSQKAYIDSINGEMMLIRPQQEAAPGHLIVATFAHVVDALVSPPLTGKLAGYAALVTRKKNMRSANIIAGVGLAAGQIVPHLHMHIIPRSADDGILMPWDQVEKPEETPKPKPTPRRPRNGTLKTME